jgi:Uma2 family endonuclease
MNAPPEPTLVDLQRRFGAIPFTRIGQNPPPGKATESDVVAIRDSDRRIFELVDGILLEKDMGSRESVIAVALIAILHHFIKPRKLGKVLGEGGMFRLMPGLVRVPDVSYLTNERYQATEGIENQRIWAVVPSLVIEVISQGNSQKEMDDKLVEYFQRGVEEVWYVYPIPQTITIYYKLDEHITIDSRTTFAHSRLLPDLQFEVAEIFED